jgi:hypothetical protein
MWDRPSLADGAERPSRPPVSLQLAISELQRMLFHSLLKLLANISLQKADTQLSFPATWWLLSTTERQPRYKADVTSAYAMQEQSMLKDIPRVHWQYEYQNRRTT